MIRVAQVRVQHTAIPANERRRRKRLALHWRVCLSRPSNHLMAECETRDMSSGGFYCFTDENFTLDERLECVLTIPLPSNSDGVESLFLRCQVKVVRVDVALPGGKKGVACRIEDYSVAHLPAGAFAAGEEAPAH